MGNYITWVNVATLANLIILAFLADRICFQTHAHIFIVPGSKLRSENTVKSMNAELRDTLQISTTHHGPSHMWTAETLGDYLQFLASELRRKRKRHGLTARSKALIIMDKAPQHSSSTFKKIRETFENDNNCILLHGESFHLVAVPGGLSCVTNNFLYIYI